MERLVATMAFCEAPLDGTLDGTTAAAAQPSSGAAAAAVCGEDVVALLDAAAKKWPPVERLVAAMAFCEAPLDGTFDGTATASAAPSKKGAAGGSGGGGGDAVKALRRARLAAIKKWPVEFNQRLMREKAGAVVVDGLKIFETVALE